MLEKFSWLHVSDFHFKAGSDQFSQEVSTTALLDDISARLSGEQPLRFVVATGDIAFSGKPSEYKVAAQFLKTLASTTGVGMDRIFVVPGNHDVDRSTQEYLYEGVVQRLTNQEAVDDFLGREPDRAALLQRQSAFRAFQDQLFADGTTRLTDDNLARVRALDVDGLRICVLELNSAWLSGSKDQPGRLLIGERQMINALRLAEKYQPHLTFCLVHHPMDWLSEFDRMSCTGRLLPRLNILHCGHLHRHEVSVRLLPGAQCILVAAGSSHVSRFFQNSYNLVEFDIGSAECRVRTFEYMTGPGAFTELSPLKHVIPLGTSNIAESADIAAVLRGIDASVHPYADYLAALLTGEMNEVPIRLDDGNWIFASRDFPAEFQFGEVREFLRIPNMLRIYDDVPLGKSIQPHRDAILNLTRLISRMETASTEFSDNMGSHTAHAKKLTRRAGGKTSPYQVQYLDDLADSGEWQALAEASRRYLSSVSEEVRIAARRRLSWALLRFDEQRDRIEGLALACQILNEPWAKFEDYIVASAGARSFGDTERAVGIAATALENWPSELGLRQYCRTLALQTGGNALVDLLKRTGEK